MSQAQLIVTERKRSGFWEDFRRLDVLAYMVVRLKVGQEAAENQGDLVLRGKICC